MHGIIASEDASTAVLQKIESTLLQLDQIDQWLSYYIHLLDVRVYRDTYLSDYGTRCASGRATE